MNVTPPELNIALVNQALRGEPVAMRQLIDALTPVVQARVARALVRRPLARRTDVTQWVKDLTQDVFVTMFADEARVLRAWAPVRGLSLLNFAGLIAEHRVAAAFRRTSVTHELLAEEECEPVMAHDQTLDMQVCSRMLLARLYDALALKLTPLGLDMFFRLYVKEQPVERICRETGLQAGAVYQWKNRLRETIRTIAADLTQDGSERWLVPTAGMSALASSRGEAP